MFEGDGYKPIKKPRHFMADWHTENDNKHTSIEYDEYIPYVDFEIGRFFKQMEGDLDNTWIILTSDHGEIFERDLVKYKFLSMYKPLIKIPLIIFPPNQTERIDVYSPTMAVDIVPTLLEITNTPKLKWFAGDVLPPFNTRPDENCSIYVMDAKYNKRREIWESASLVMIKNGLI